MLRPVLLIGVGGSGGKTLRAMSQSLLRKLRKAGWTKDQLPEGWQMLWVDSVSQQDEDAFPAPLLPNTQYVGLVPPGLAYADLRTTLEQSIQPKERMAALAGWVPESVPIAVAAGAGQARAIGRAISAAQIFPLKAAIENANNRLSGINVTTELAEISKLFGQSDSSPVTIPLAIVISSVAGGSGSGMFMDVVETLKTVNPDFASPDGIITILYTPDVFASIEGAGGQIPPNTLAAAMEVTSGVLSQGLTSGSVSMLQSRGLVNRSRHGFGAKCNFLVGASNKNITLGSQSDVYYAVGESLTSIVTDDKVQQNLRAFIITNVFLQSGNSMLVQDNSKMTEASDPDESMPFSAMGMGRINLGTDRLADYIAQFLTRDTTEQLLWPDYENNIQADGQRRTSEEMIDDLIAWTWGDFLASSKLNERDPANDVVDALVDLPQLEQSLLQWAREGLNKANQAVDAGGLPPGEWVRRLQNYYDNNISVLKAQAKANTYLQAQDWTSSIQTTLTQLIAQTSVRHGLVVTGRLLQRLIEEMEYVTQELNTQVVTKRAQTQMMASHIQQVLNVGANKLPSNDDALNKAVSALQLGAGLEVDADRFEIAASLVDDLTQNLLKPLLKSVRFARAELAASVNSNQLPDGRPNNWQLLPEFGKPVPTQLRPGATERVLIQPERYQEVLREEVQACLKKGQDKSFWRSLLRERAALGQVLDTGENDGRGIIEEVVAWIPQDSHASTARGSGKAAEFVIPKSFTAVQQVMERWVADVTLSTGLSKFLKQSLVKYVESGTPEEQIQRQADFIGAFSEVVQIAAPFVDINPAVKAALHPNVKDEVRPLISTIPFVEGHPLYARIKSILAAGDLWWDTISKEWFGTSDTDQISIFTVSGSAMLPMVFDNLMRPIAQSWAANSNNVDRRHAFWAMRRARPLAEFIPAGPRQIASMTRGWFMAGLLNQRVMNDEGSSGWKVQVWDEETRDLIDFPFPLLSARVVSQNALPAAVLKSLAIAFVKVNEAGNISPLRPYHRLMELGADSRYPTILSDWIKLGVVAGNGAPTPDLKIAGSTSSTLDERRDAVVNVLEKTLAKYEQEFAEIEDKPNPYTAPPIWELRDFILPALGALIVAAQSVRDDEGTL
jgi:hypothetical protein